MRSRLGPLRTTNTLLGSMPPRSIAMRRYEWLVAIETSAARKVSLSSQTISFHSTPRRPNFASYSSGLAS